MEFLPTTHFFPFPSIPSIASRLETSQQMPTAISVLTTIAFASGFLYLIYAIWVFRQWEKAFAGRRLTRCAEACPSNKALPDIKSFEQSKSRILGNVPTRKIKHCGSLSKLKNVETGTKRNTTLHKRAKRTGSLTAITSIESLESKMIAPLSNQKAKELNMDHVFVPFSDFLWAYTFIGPFSYILWKKGTLIFQLRKFLHKIGVINLKCDYEALAATLLLEQSQAVHYCVQRENKEAKEGNIAAFFFADFPYVSGDNCDFQVAKLFSLDVDLNSKKLVTAKLDKEILTAKEAVTLLWYNTIAAQHVKLHAMANWGINVDDSLKELNPFLRQNSVVTTMYNYFGYTTFSGFIKTWVDQGLLSQGWAKPHAPFLESINHGIAENIVPHAQIEDLFKYSRFVKFAIHVRAIFLSEFQKHKHLFPGVDGEAMFVGTVLHSLDHTFMDWNLKDPLYLDTTDNRFGKMAEMGQVVKVGFVSDVDGLYFNKRFKGSNHPFYEAVYKKAARVDKLLADNMDTCIIK